MILPISHKHKPTQARTSRIETRAQTDLQMRPPCETCPASSTEHKYPSTNSSQAPTCNDTNMCIVQSKPIKAHSWTTQWSKCGALREDINKKTFSFGYCPNHLTPPPDPNSGNLVLFFGRQKRRFACITDFFYDDNDGCNDNYDW